MKTLSMQSPINRGELLHLRVRVKKQSQIQTSNIRKPDAVPSTNTSKMIRCDLGPALIIEQHYVANLLVGIIEDGRHVTP